MKKTLYLLFLLGTTVLFTACPSKEDSDDGGKTTYTFNEEIKNYVFMPVGSWWVYEDSATGDLDTITLISSETNFTKDEIEKLEYIDMTYTSSYNSGEIWRGGMQK